MIRIKFCNIVIWYVKNTCTNIDINKTEDEEMQRHQAKLWDWNFLNFELYFIKCIS